MPIQSIVVGEVVDDPPSSALMLTMMMTHHHGIVVVVVVVDSGHVVMVKCPEVPLENPSQIADRLLWIVETRVIAETASPEDSKLESLPHIKG